MRPKHTSRERRFDWRQIAFYHQPLSTPVREGGWPVALATNAIRREVGADGAVQYIFEPAFSVLASARDAVHRVAAPRIPATETAEVVARPGLPKWLN
jgi:hypothetical protein